MAAQLARRLPARVVSLDEINSERGLDGGQGVSVDDWIVANDLGRDRARSLLVEGSDVIVDDSCSLRFLRNAWRDVADAAHAHFQLVWIRIDPGLQRDRVLANRDSTVRPDVVDQILIDTARDFEPPSEDETPLVIDSRAASSTDWVALIGRLRTTTSSED